MKEIYGLLDNVPVPQAYVHKGGNHHYQRKLRIVFESQAISYQSEKSVFFIVNPILFVFRVLGELIHILGSMNS